jgi:hypothetical protein
MSRLATFLRVELPLAWPGVLSIVLEECIEAVRAGEQRRDRVDGYLRAQIPTWSLSPLVQSGTPHPLVSDPSGLPGWIGLW